MAEEAVTVAMMDMGMAVTTMGQAMEMDRAMVTAMGRIIVHGEVGEAEAEAEEVEVVVGEEAVAVVAAASFNLLKSRAMFQLCCNVPHRRACQQK